MPPALVTLHDNSGRAYVGVEVADMRTIRYASGIVNLAVTGLPFEIPMLAYLSSPEFVQFIC